MAITHIEHIGIALGDMNSGEKSFSSLLDQVPYKKEEVESEGVNTVFFKCGQSKVELLNATREDSPIAKFVDKKGEGIHHIAFATDDIEADLRRMESSGFELIHKTPKAGADGKIIAFLHPKSTHGVLIELCQDSSQ